MRLRHKLKVWPLNNGVHRAGFLAEPTAAKQPLSRAEIYLLWDDYDNISIQSLRGVKQHLVWSTKWLFEGLEGLLDSPVDAFGHVQVIPAGSR